MALQTSFIFSTLTLANQDIYIYIYMIKDWISQFECQMTTPQTVHSSCCFACSGRGIHGNLLLGNPPSNMTGLALPGGNGRVQGEAAWSSCII
jgi:hypothetical protein